MPVPAFHPSFCRAALIALIALALAPHAQAQQLYRCGNTYSQIPCAQDAPAKRIFSDAADGGTDAAGKGFALCSTHAVQAAEVQDPDTARIRPQGPRRSEVIQYAGQPMQAHRYDLTIDAKGPTGRYAGPVGYSCWLSEDQARVLLFGPRGAR
jgi:hypothetical protein